MTIEQLLALRQRWNPSLIVLPTPASWNAFVHRAREAGVLSRLLVVNQPLMPGLRGGYDPATQELWYALNPARESPEALLPSLFALLARAALRRPAARTIIEDWDLEWDAWEAVPALMQAWGWPDVLSQEALQERKRELVCLRWRHQMAGQLVGTAHPRVARAAYLTLTRLQQAHGWSEDQFDDALVYSWAEEAHKNAVLDVDRAALRGSWRVTSRRGAPGALPGIQTPPETEQARDLLREALRTAAHMQAEALRSMEHITSRHLAFHLVGDQEDLAAVIKRTVSWLAEEEPALAVEGRWQVFGTRQTDRIYHLSVRYIPPVLSEPLLAAQPVIRDLWVLFPGTPRPVEVAWQRFLRSWLSPMDLSCHASIRTGMHRLWAQLT